MHRTPVDEARRTAAHDGELARSRARARTGASKASGPTRGSEPKHQVHKATKRASGATCLDSMIRHLAEVWALT